MTWEEAAEACEGHNVFPACHNDPNSVTLSGDMDSVLALTQTLRDRGIRVTDVDSAGVAFHSPILKPCKKQFRSALKKVSIAL